MGWIVWDKGQHGLTMSDGELAWSSFDKALRIITLNRCTIGERGGNIHRCQKPVKLYAEILRKNAKEGDKIFDSHLGSGSSRIAAYGLGGVHPDWDKITCFRIGFKEGARWQTKQPPWVSVKERLPDENEDIIILCKHGAIFNGTYSNNIWFCMDGYIYDTYKGNPIYSSMSSIPPSWEPIAWMPKPKFEE